MNAITVKIIAVIVQMLPLILIPLLLKGLLDAIPILGKFASNALNKSNKMAGQYAKDSGFFGRRRAEYMNNQRGLLGGKINPNTNRTFGNRFQSYKRARGEQIKAIEETGSQEYRQRILNGDTSLSSTIGREAHHQEETAKIVGAETDQGFKTSLAERRVTDSNLRSIDQRTRARALAEQTANDEGQQDFTSALRDQYNPLNNLAAGTVNAEAGRVRAQSAAVSAGFDVDDRGIKNQKSLLTQQLTDIQKEGAKPELDENGAQVLKNGQVVMKPAARVAQDYLIEQLGSQDFYTMAAARDTLMAQGSSGVDAFRQKYQQLEKSGHFSQSKDMQDLQVAFSRNTVSTHGQALKAKSKDFLNAFTKGQSVEAASRDAATWKGQNDDELAGGTTSYLLRGIDSGGIDAKRAAAILSDDVIRNKFDQEKIQILQVLKDGGNIEGKRAVTTIWNANTGRVNKQANSDTVPLGDTNDTIQISSVVVPGIPVPAAGSPVGVFKDFIDKSSGVSRLDRDDFVKLRDSVSASNLDSNNDDVKNLRASISAEITRRNAEAASVNRVVGSQVYTDIAGSTDSPDPGSNPDDGGPQNGTS